MDAPFVNRSGLLEPFYLAAKVHTWGGRDQQKGFCLISEGSVAHPATGQPSILPDIRGLLATVRAEITRPHLIENLKQNGPMLSRFPSHEAV